MQCACVLQILCISSSELEEVKSKVIKICKSHKNREGIITTERNNSRILVDFLYSAKEQNKEQLWQI